MAALKAGCLHIGLSDDGQATEDPRVAVQLNNTGEAIQGRYFVEGSNNNIAFAFVTTPNVTTLDGEINSLTVQPITGQSESFALTSAERVEPLDAGLYIVDVEDSNICVDRYGRVVRLSLDNSRVLALDGAGNLAHVAVSSVDLQQFGYVIGEQDSGNIMVDGVQYALGVSYNLEQWHRV